MLTAESFHPLPLVSHWKGREGGVKREEGGREGGERDGGFDGFWLCGLCGGYGIGIGEIPNGDGMAAK